jgi:hypothetical protein
MRKRVTEERQGRQSDATSERSRGDVGRTRWICYGKEETSEKGERRKEREKENPYPAAATAAAAISHPLTASSSPPPRP